MNHAERFKQAAKARNEETRVAFVTRDPTIGQASPFPHKIEIAHGGEHWKSARLEALKIEGDRSGRTLDERRDWIKRLETPGAEDVEIEAALNRAILNTILVSAVVVRIGWVGPSYPSKNQAKKWESGEEPVELLGERAKPPAGVSEKFAREPESWGFEGYDRAFASEAKAKKWQGQALKQAKEVLKKDPQSVQVLANAKPTKNETRQWRLPKEYFMDEYSVTEAADVEAFLRAFPQAAIDIYNARSHWDVLRQAELEEQAKN